MYSPPPFFRHSTNSFKYDFIMYDGSDAPIRFGIGGSCSVVGGCLSVIVGCVLQDVVEVVLEVVEVVLVEEEVVDILLAGCFLSSLLSC